MILRIDRKPTERETTFGQLFIDGVFECYTLEDAIRDHKLPGQTCIPPGRFRVSLEHSPRFGPDTLSILSVPDFTGVRIHGGNDKDDTEGCPIVGDRIDRDSLSISGAAARGVLKRLKDKVRAALQDGGEVWLTINNPL